MLCFCYYVIALSGALTLSSQKLSTPRSSHATAATIAAHIGLSRATVAHVLNGRGDAQRIRPETQRRVLEAAQELGYRPNASATALRSGRFGSVALIQSQHGEYLPPELLLGLTSGVAAADNRVRLMLTQVLNIDASPEEYLKQIMQQLSADGVFVNRHGFAPAPYLDRIQKLRIPANFVNSKQEFDAAYPDDVHGGMAAAQYLLDLGHTRIAYVDTLPRPRPHYSEADRRTGYEQAMRAAGHAAQTCSLPIEWRDGAGAALADAREEAARALLMSSDRPTAILAYEQTEAMAVVRAALSLGMRIPDDLSLVRFHHRMDDQCFVPIHTMSNSMRAVGERAAAMLMQKIEDPELILPSAAVPEVLIEGATCRRYQGKP